MSWLIIAGGIAFIFGSFMMLKPSPRDTRLAKLRFTAIQQGLQVRQVQWQSNPKHTGIYTPISATGYSLLRPHIENPNENTGQLLFAIAAQKGWETEHLPAGYSWHKVGTEQQAKHFIQALAQLQDQLHLLEVWENKILIVPHEGPNASALAYKNFMEGFLTPATIN